jgi:hypothetical protein
LHFAQATIQENAEKGFFLQIFESLRAERASFELAKIPFLWLIPSNKLLIQNVFRITFWVY